MSPTPEKLSVKQSYLSINQCWGILNRKATNLQDRSLYFSSFESFFFDLALATVSKTAWATQKAIRSGTNWVHRVGGCEYAMNFLRQASVQTFSFLFLLPTPSLRFDAHIAPSITLQTFVTSELLQVLGFQEGKILEIVNGIMRIAQPGSGFGSLTMSYGRITESDGRDLSVLISKDEMDPALFSSKLRYERRKPTK
uniref:Uncharacterized protein n=1 Tax=Salix viminalis TaxID=40686 RepID=A0A6N2NGL1_SALVM